MGNLSVIIFFLGVFTLPYGELARTVQFTNRCNKPIWISTLTNAQGPELAPGIQKINARGDVTYNIPNGGWEGRFWPKEGCDSSGHNCEVGQSIPPCPSGGCHPPAETKVEFNFPPLNGPQVYYDISLVDGYTIPAEIVPSKIGGTCTRTNCRLSLDRCPSEDEVGDLKWPRNGKVTQCLSPCKKWNYPPPYGLGKSEHEGNGKWYCCPTPPVTPQQCSSNIVVNTKYVKLVHEQCPTAYSYAYDDEGGLHYCPNDVSFQVYFC